MIDKTGYKNYQPVLGYNINEQKLKQYDAVLSKIIDIGIKGKKILEPGQLYGYYSFGMARAGADVIGVEVNKDNHNICIELNKFYNLSVNFINEDILRYDFETEGFDGIVWMNVFHHCLFRQKWLAISTIHRISEYIPWMVLCMGTELGNRVSGMEQSQIPFFILEETKYCYAKKIAEWGKRNVYLFTK
jgi:SAM-dependent methyltransferase